MSIHKRIKERRLAMGLDSHLALAEKVGVAWQTVQQWEKEGGTAPNRKRMPIVARELGTTEEFLRTGYSTTSEIPPEIVTLLERYERADAQTKQLIDLALQNPNDPLPDEISPSVRNMLNAIRISLPAK